MPQKITSREVCRRIVLQRSEALETVLEHTTAVGYTKTMFIEDMSANDFISSRSTILSKWSTLVSDGIVTYSGKRSELDIPMLYMRAGIAVPRKEKKSSVGIGEVCE